MSLSQVRVVNFGSSKANLTGSVSGSGVGYALYASNGSVFAARTIAGVYQFGSGSGCYGASISFGDGFNGTILWDTGEATGSAVYAVEQYNTEENDAKIATIHTNVQSVTASLSSLASNVNTTSNKVSAVTASIASLTSDVNTVSNKVSNVTASLSVLTSNVNTVSNNVSNVTASFAAITSDVNTVSNKISAVTASVSTLTSNINTVSNNVSNVTASLSTVSGQVTLISGAVDFIRDIEGGRWKIDTGANQMLFYKSDNTTLVATFDLKDSAGAATSTNPFERTRA